MKSVSGNNWEEIDINKRLVEKIKIDYNLSDIICKLIISRNFSKFEIDSINKKVDLINPFIRNKDFIKGQDLLIKAINNKDKIIVLGDYDVDGCVSTSLLINFFNKINYPCDYFIPHRIKHGYGASIKSIKELIKKKPKLIIMLDCGSNSVDAINLLKKLNIKTMIIDHHEIYKPYPKSDVLINPKKESDYQELNYFCSAALTYFFIDTIIRKKKLKINFNENLIFVLLATICDVMPLRKINRLIAMNVFDNFALQDNYLFNKFLLLTKKKRPLTIDDFGYLIGPILNSAGRLNDGKIVVQLITNKNLDIKDILMKSLINLNEKRKKIEKDSINRINFDELSKNKNDIICVFNCFFNEGIIGILASKLKEYFNKPSIIFAQSNNQLKASARSTIDFNIGKYIKKAIDKNILLNGGGHNLAAGFSLKKNKIKDFETFINDIGKKIIKKKSKTYISKVSINAINNTFYKDLKKLEPYGQENPNPFFLLENVQIIKPKILKNDFLSFFVKSNSGKLIKGISFSLLESEVGKNILYNKNKMSLIIQIKENLWNNKKNLQIIVSDIILLSNKA